MKSESNVICANKTCRLPFQPKEEHQLYCSHACKHSEMKRRARRRNAGDQTELNNKRIRDEEYKKTHKPKE